MPELISLRDTVSEIVDILVDTISPDPSLAAHRQEWRNMLDGRPTADELTRALTDRVMFTAEVTKIAERGWLNKEVTIWGKRAGSGARVQITEHEEVDLEIHSHQILAPG